MDISRIKNTVIFHGMSEDEIAAALEGLGATSKKYKKGSTILLSGFTTDKMGLVMEGSVIIENNDVWGNKTILSHVEKNQFFAETYALLSDEPMLVDVIANEDSEILFLKIGHLNLANIKKESWASDFIRNLLTISAHKNLTLSGRSFHTSPKTIRGRVMSYLNSIYIRTGKTEFDIPFDRQQMADYLNLERTALSKELGRMKRAGLIEFDRNHFRLYRTQDI